MLSVLAIAYKRGYDGKNYPRYAIKGSLAEKKWKEGKADRDAKKPMRY